MIVDKNRKCPIFKCLEVCENKWHPMATVFLLVAAPIVLLILVACEYMTIKSGQN